MSAIIDTLRATLRAVPDNWQCRLALIEALVAEDRTEEAYSVLSNVTELPADRKSNLLAAKAYGTLEPARGIEILDGIIASDPTCAQAYYDKAVLCYYTGELEMAARQYTAATTFDAALANPEFAAMLGGGTAEINEAQDAAPITPVPLAPPGASDEGVYYPAPGEYPTITLRESLAAIHPEPLVHPEAIPELPHLAYQDEVDYAPTVHTEEPQYRENLHNVDVHTALQALPVSYDYQHPDNTIFEPTISDDEIYVGALVTESGERVANLQQSIRRNKAQKDAEIAQKEKVAKIQSLSVAILTLAGICMLMVLAVVATPRPSPPQIVASSVVSPQDDALEKTQIQQTKITPTPQQSASAMSMEVMTVASASDMSMMSFDAPTMDLGAASFGTDFGSSMSFGDAGGGMVSFFGSKTNAKKVVFVVDASASMKATGDKKNKKGKTKMELMKEELIRTVTVLPDGVEFQILFFSGPSWFLDLTPASGDEIEQTAAIRTYNRALKKKAAKDWTRHAGGGNFWEYLGGDPKKWPEQAYIKSTPSNRRRAATMIKSTPMMLGTDWRDPLKMAMVMKPDTIYFMTDGAVGKHPDKPPVVPDVLAFNKKHSKAQINTVCLMILQAAENLKALADGTKGEFTLVKEDGTSVRGRELEKLMGKKKK